MSLYLLQKKIKEKKIGIRSILGRIRIWNWTRIRYPGSVKMKRIRNTDFTVRFDLDFRD